LRLGVRRGFLSFGELIGLRTYLPKLIFCRVEPRRLLSRSLMPAFCPSREMRQGSGIAA
jgi:hypothetical protein